MGLPKTEGGYRGGIGAQNARAQADAMCLWQVGYLLALCRVKPAFRTD